ncbi:MAG: nuclear transport factor 2 family protein [Gemmatimonadota bacterium]
MKRGIGRSRSAALVLVMVALGATPGVVEAQSSSGDGLPPTIDLPAGLDAVLRGYEAAWTARDADGLAALFTEDGYVLRPGYPPVVGRDAIRRAYANSGGPLALKAYAYAIEGDVGYIVGGFALSADSPEVGKYTLTLRRQASGAWLIFSDMDNGNR